MSAVLVGDDLCVTVEPELGGSITAIEHRRSGRQLLARTPWRAQCLRSATVPARGEVDDWLRRYPGGWQVLLPNVGPAGMVDGMQHNWHGEASLDPFTPVETSATSMVVERTLVAAPLHVRRRIALTDGRVDVTDTVQNTGSSPYAFLWQHHPAFRADPVHGRCRVSFQGTLDPGDDAYPDRRTAPHPADDAKLPPVAIESTTRGSDLRYVADLPAQAWAGIEHETLDGPPLSALLAFDGGLFPVLWIWNETGGDPGAPWFGRLRALGVEPAQSWPVTGLAQLTSAAFSAATTLDPGQVTTTTVSLLVSDRASVWELRGSVADGGWPTTTTSIGAAGTESAPCPIT